MATHVDEMQRRHARRRALFSPVPDSPDVVAVAQPDDRGAMSAGSPYRVLHRLEPVDLPERHVAVEHAERSEVLHDRCVAVDRQLTGASAAHIGGEHSDAVRVVPGKVGFDQLVGDQLLFGLGAAEMSAGIAHKGVEFVGVDQRHGRPRCRA